MIKLQLSETINAPKEKVWQTLWNEATYTQWTSVFSEGSRMVSDWTEGGKVHFLDTEGQGMYSTLEHLQPDTHVSFRHIGTIKNGLEQPVTEAQSWSGMTENYTLKQDGNKTILTVEMETTDEAAEYFQKTFPAALAKVKALAETSD